MPVAPVGVVRHGRDVVLFGEANAAYHVLASGLILKLGTLPSRRSQHGLSRDNGVSGSVVSLI